MSLKAEIKPYIDGNGLVNCSLNHGDGKRGSDNGVSFTSEYYILLADNGELTPEDAKAYADKIKECSVEPGLVARAPGKMQGGPPPDDLYAIASASKVLKQSNIAKAIVDYGDEHEWIMNANYPGSPHWYPGAYDYEAWMGRQIGLVCALTVAAGEKPNPLLAFITSIIIATSCMGTDTGNSDARRGGYHLVRAVSDQKGLLGLACRIWWWRLRKDYGNEGMRAVARIYYQDNHPFMRYWRNPWDV